MNVSLDLSDGSRVSISKRIPARDDPEEGSTKPVIFVAISSGRGDQGTGHAKISTEDCLLLAALFKNAAESLKA